MKRFVQAFAVPLALGIVLVQGDSKLAAVAPLAPEFGSSYLVEVLPGTLGQMPLSSALVPVKPGTQNLRTYQLLQSRPPVSGPGDNIPQAYTVYGLRTGPGGMAFTDQNGVALPVPSHPRIITGPLNGMQSLPLLKVPPGIPVQPYYAPLPIPKK